MSAVDTLHDRLAALTQAGRPPACLADPNRNAWISEREAEREYARHRCGGCPLTRECLAAAVELKVSAGVWSGRSITSPQHLRDARKELA